MALKELGLPFISVSAPSIVSGMSGESEKTLRETFDEAKVPYFLLLCEPNSYIDCSVLHLVCCS
jgi:SpoVK/Ycf46/Vps4 family AAA+-type ATPase